MNAASQDASTILFQAWCNPEPDTVSRVLTSVPIPGDLALRSRYETLIDLVSSPANTATLTRELWDKQVTLMRAGDAAVQANNQQSGLEAFTSLRDSHDEADHPLPLIDAEIGLADLARQRDDMAAAVKHYSVAMELAGKHHCQFARVRAGLGLGYTQLNQASAGSARASFDMAIAISKKRDWRLSLANSLVGRGECHARFRKWFQAMRDLLDALEIFEDLHSDPGVANAAIQLGELGRRNSWHEDALGWYSTALEVLGSAGPPISRANALDGMAEIEVELQEFRAARRHFGQAARVSLPSYPRGYAHALNGLARCAETQGKRALALHFFRKARDAYAKLGVFPSVAASCSGIARCANSVGKPGLELAARLECVAMIERSRVAQIRHQDQAEYFERFGEYYFEALRTALGQGSIESFVAVFEVIAGRRLAGLFDIEQGAETAKFIAQLARLSAEFEGEPVEDQDKNRRTNRMIGRIALGATLPNLARSAIDDAMTEVYQPMDLDGAADLCARAVSGRPILILLVEDERNAQIIWLAFLSTELKPHGGTWPIPEVTQNLLKEFHISGLPADATPTNIAPLQHLLPPQLIELISEDELVTLVPVGRLWHVPWACFPIAARENDETEVAKRFLIEVAPLSLAPTVTFAGRQNCVPQADKTLTLESSITSISWWKSATVISHTADAFMRASVVPGRKIRQLPSGSAARHALLRSEDDLLVLIAHGHPAAGTVHFIDLDDAIAVTPADLLEANPPKYLILISCWGAAAPQTKYGDPLSVVTVALARGAHSVVATTSELLDDPLSCAFVNLFLDSALTLHLPFALQESAKRFLARPDARSGYLSRWAPLTVIGH